MLGQPAYGRGNAWFARSQDPMLFQVLPCQAQGQPWAMPGSVHAKTSPGAWTPAQRKRAKRHVALRLSTLRREPKRHVSHMVFFHSNNSFLKFINDDNNIYNTNNNIFNSNNMNYYKNNIIYNTKYNNILEINTINYTKN